MTHDARKSTTVGILYPGELGSAVASLLAARGARVVTALGHRGARTARRCREAGVEVLPTLRELAATAPIVISLVPPCAAEQVAAEWCAAAPANARLLYVDANSIGPELASCIAARVSATGHSFVDAAVNGLARNLTTGATLFLSGPRAAEVAGLFGDAMRVQLLGDEPGRASGMKMLLSGLSKGLCALFAETALLADRQAMLPEMIDAYRLIYPGVMTIVERMLPTYAEHAARRAGEMGELEATARAAGLDPLVLTAVRELHEQFAHVTFDQLPSDQWTVPAIVQRLAAVGALLQKDQAHRRRQVVVGKTS